MSNQDTSRAKGKGRADGENPSSQSAANGPSTAGSLAARVASSASALARDALGPGSAAASTASLASTRAASAGQQKAGSAAPTSGASSEFWSRQAGSSQSSSVGEAFRSSENYTTYSAFTPRANDEFEQWSRSQPLVGQDAAFESAWAPTESAAHSRPKAYTQPQYQAAPDDGAEVVALLNDPHFGIGNRLEDLAEDIADRDEVDAAAADLFGPEAAQGPAHHPGTALALPSPSTATALVGLDQAGSRRASTVFIEADDAQRQQWLAEWLDEWARALASYTDDVWAPDREGRAVAAAKNAVDQARARPVAEFVRDRAAVRRLRLVLGHLTPESGGQAGEAGQVGQASASRARAGQKDGPGAAADPSADRAAWACPDCGAAYSAPDHLAVHQQWLDGSARDAAASVEPADATAELQLLARILAQRPGRRA